MRRINAENTLHQLAKNDARFSLTKQKILELQNIRFKVFLKIMAELQGKEVLIKFVPKRGEFNRINDSVARLGAKIEESASKDAEDMEKFNGDSANLFDLWGDSLLFALPRILNNARSSLFQSIKGVVQVSISFKKETPAVVLSGELLFGQYENIVRTLIGYKAKDPERMKRYRATTSKKVQAKPIFFWMQGTVPDRHILLKLHPNDTPPNIE